VTLNRALAEGCEWTKLEQVALGHIEAAADRAAVLRGVFDVEMARPQVSTRRVTELAAEMRQTEAAIVRLVAQLVPDPDTSVPPKSTPHQAAARTRWDRRSHRPQVVPLAPNRGAEVCAGHFTLSSAGAAVQPSCPSSFWYRLIA
jgi:hypothetical protein